jgi:hypothetical protein
MIGTIQYRIYTLERNGHFASSTMIECGGDEEAIEQTKQLVDGNVLELWSGVKFLGRFESGSSTEASQPLAIL